MTDQPGFRGSHIFDEYADWHRAIEVMVGRAVKARQERVERVLLQALAGGKHGVLVVTSFSTGEEVAEISPQVPYGRIAYLPTWSGGLFDRALDLEPASADELRIITAYLARKLLQQ